MAASAGPLSKRTPLAFELRSFAFGDADPKAKPPLQRVRVSQQGFALRAAAYFGLAMPGLIAQAMILTSLWWWSDLNSELQSAEDELGVKHSFNKGECALTLSDGAQVPWLDFRHSRRRPGPEHVEMNREIHVSTHGAPQRGPFPRQTKWPSRGLSLER